jgi:hypothetical protein
MKKLIVIVGLISFYGAHAGELVRTPIIDYLPTDNYAMFEIKTKLYQKVILDCQGFNMGVYFYKHNKIQNQIHMDESDCQNFHQFLTDSKAQNHLGCLEYDAEAKQLEVTDKKAKECKN